MQRAQRLRIGALEGEVEAALAARREVEARAEMVEAQLRQTHEDKEKEQEDLVKQRVQQLCVAQQHDEQSKVAKLVAAVQILGERLRHAETKAADMARTSGIGREQEEG